MGCFGVPGFGPGGSSILGTAGISSWISGFWIGFPWVKSQLLLITGRPKASEVLHHPVFFSSEKRLTFLCKISSIVQLEITRASNSDFLNALEGIASMVFDGRWDKKIDHVLRAEIGQRRYDYTLVRDLLRAIRNKWIHRIELPEAVKVPSPLELC